MNHPNIELFLPKKTGITEPANDYNDENIFVLGSVFPKVGAITVDSHACKQLAKHMKAEIGRIIAGSKPYTPCRRLCRQALEKRVTISHVS